MVGDSQYGLKLELVGELERDGDHLDAPAAQARELISLRA